MYIHICIYTCIYIYRGYPYVYMYETPSFSFIASGGDLIWQELRHLRRIHLIINEYAYTIHEYGFACKHEFIHAHI